MNAETRRQDPVGPKCEHCGTRGKLSRKGRCRECGAPVAEEQEGMKIREALAPLTLQETEQYIRQESDTFRTEPVTEANRAQLERVMGAEKVRLVIGGVTPQQMEYLEMARERLDRQMGMASAQRGLAGTPAGQSLAALGQQVAASRQRQGIGHPSGYGSLGGPLSSILGGLGL